VDKSDNEAVGFEHSGNFALVDRDGYIRSRAVILGGGNKNWIYSYAGVAEGEFQPAQIEEITQDAITLLKN
jgi:protein SCO1/2